MAVLPPFRAALERENPPQTVIAKRMDLSLSQTYKYLSGAVVIPKYRYPALDAAIGAPVDWPAYEKIMLANRGNSGASAKIRYAGQDSNSSVPERAPVTPAPPVPPGTKRRTPGQIARYGKPAAAAPTPRRITATPPSAAAAPPPDATDDDEPDFWSGIL